MNVGPDKVQDPERDRFVLSKGHCVEALYTILADKVDSSRKKNFPDLIPKYLSKFIGHPNNKIAGVEVNSGYGSRPGGWRRHGLGRKNGSARLSDLRRLR